MLIWKQAITNKAHAEYTTPQCVRDLKTGKIIKCTETDKYVFDNKLSPRCDGGPDEVYQRSVYYSLRKTMKCTQRRAPTTIKPTVVFDRNHLKFKHTEHKLKTNSWHQEEMDLIMKRQKYMRQQQQKKKYQQTMASNDLKFVLKKIPIQNDSDVELNNI